MRRNRGFQDGYCRKTFAGSEHFSNQKGIALVTGLILMLVLALLSFVAFQYSIEDISRTKNYTKTRQATYIAEAGIDRALNYFNYNGAGNSPGDVANGFDDELDNSNWPAGTFTSIGLGTGGGTYSVVIADNADGDSDPNVDVDKSVILTSTGIIDGGTVSIEAVIYRPLFQSNHAISTNGSLTINGNPTVQGTNGSVHTNVDLALTGNPSISETATTTGTVTTTGSPTVTGGTASGAAEDNIPTLNISDYKVYADYVLTSDGRVESPPGTTIHTFSTDGKWKTSSALSCSGKGWDFSIGPPVEWNVADDCGPEGNFYAEGSFIVGNVGSNSDPWETTLIAEGHIIISGNPEFENFKDPADSADIQNIFFMAGTDIEWSGNPTNTIQGLIYAGEQKPRILQWKKTRFREILRSRTTEIWSPRF